MEVVATGRRGAPHIKWGVPITSGELPTSSGGLPTWEFPTSSGELPSLFAGVGAIGNPPTRYLPG